MTKKSSAEFAPEINLLSTMTHQESIKGALVILEKFTFINPAKKLRLCNDIMNARRPSEVCRIMYYSILAGEGLSVIGGKGTWQKDFS